MTPRPVLILSRSPSAASGETLCGEPGDACCSVSLQLNVPLCTGAERERWAGNKSSIQPPGKGTAGIGNDFNPV
ncbi:hypothetical protein CesoFtcFv8_010771 [Champsocephalus esox]|uniref:Uncharacterized protein n=2 Tax=Champsocephalus TaxID=52236 RepID=A0AAN8DIT0_CHAGU|nr:hypothetical protein CesoFtcFv8_010771 [Champsocephalus esox]KAK5923072.1 hypothetical protein CgunFtcFv8_000077 [Champsocephalus gunnari]